MRILPTIIHHDGFELRQIIREGMVAIYEQHKNSRLNSWEVIRIKTRPAGEVFGRTVEEREVYPSSDAWGHDGWTFKSLDLAQAKMDEMQRNVHTVPCAEEVA